MKSELNKPEFRPINIALFCGGRGSATIIHELLRRTDVNLTLIVNAYDDGLSTGALRDFVANMLGPSDFRKNLSYLLDLSSKGQYALKNLLEFRLPKTIKQNDIANLIAFIKDEKPVDLIEPLFELFKQLNSRLLRRIRQFLSIFFNYAEKMTQPFDYADCAIGNLIFAGAYLEQDQNFNAAAKELSQLVNSRAILVNVSQNENRILAGLKEDGELLATEAQIVGPQSPVPIRNFFLLKKAISPDEWQAIKDQSVAEKEAWLRAREVLPAISPEAENALTHADIIIYGPGTQHSSLFPSYRIANKNLRSAKAPVKVFVMNLEPDYDIQTLAAKDVLDRALGYMNDPDNDTKVITHVLLDNSLSNNQLNIESLSSHTSYKNAEIVLHTFSNNYQKKVHNGRLVVEKIFSLRAKTLVGDQHHSAVDIFVDINKRSLALGALTQEFLEMDWRSQFSDVKLTINKLSGETIRDANVAMTEGQLDGIFPEVKFFLQWLNKDKSEYLVLLTGDGEYRFRDVMLGIRLLEQSHFGAVFGSRTQSRQQFRISIRAAYEENRFLRTLSSFGGFLLSAIYALRFGVIFSDPLTGFRIFKRSKLIHLVNHLPIKKTATPVTIARYLISNKIDIAELPVNYRTFSGFTDPNWRVRRGIKNLLSIFI